MGAANCSGALPRPSCSTAARTSDPTWLKCAGSPYGAQDTHTGATDTPLRWNGQYQDTQTGLYYLRARYYDPTTAQFLTRDPLEAQTHSAYGYAGDNPLNAADPTGLSKCGDWFDPGSYVDCAAKAADAVGNAAESVIPRSPDYVTLDIAGGAVLPTPIPIPVVGGLTVTLTRNGHLYFGPQGGLGVPGLSGSLRAGWINQGASPSCNQIDSFVGGPSATVSGYAPVVGGIAGPAAAETWGNEGGTNANDFGTEFGVGVGEGRSLSLTQSYSFRVPFDLPISW